MERVPRPGWAYRSRRRSAARALSYLTSDIKRDPVHWGYDKRMERVPRPGWAYRSRRGSAARALSYLTSDIKRDPVHWGFRISQENGTGPKARLGVPIQKRQCCAGSVLFNFRHQKRSGALRIQDFTREWNGSQGQAGRTEPCIGWLPNMSVIQLRRGSNSAFYPKFYKKRRKLWPKRGSQQNTLN